MRPARRSGALVALVAAALACAVHGAGAPAPARGAAIDVAAYARLLQMEDARRLDTAVVRAALGSGHPVERAHAALAVGRVHGTAMAPLLRLSTHPATLETPAGGPALWLFLPGAALMAAAALLASRLT